MTMTESDSHILIVDDDRRIRELLATYLASHGYRVTGAANAAEAGKAMAGLAFDLVVLDVMMPGENGFSFAANLRGQGNTIPILMLSALADSADRIKGLTQGSDDYLAKPFEPEELLLRLRNLLRRAVPSVSAAKIVRFGDCVFDIESGELLKAQRRLHLTSREKEILRALARQVGVTLARADFASNGSDEGVRAIDVQINRLRQKIEIDPTQPIYLQTVRGHGYCLYAEGI